MKDARFQRLIRQYLLPHLPGFRAKKSLVFAEPLEYLLRGFALESSGFGPSVFYLWVFVQPLYVPSTHIYFHFGRRLGHGWDLDANADNESEVMGQVLTRIKDEGLPFINRFESPADFADRAAQI